MKCTSFLVCKFCLLTTLVSAQRYGFQFSINKLDLNTTEEEVTHSSDTSALFYPKYNRGSQDFGLSIGLTYKKDKCLLSIQSGYYQDYFKNKEIESVVASSSITNVKNRNYGLFLGLGLYKNLYANKKILVNYGATLYGTIGIKDDLSIHTNYFDSNNNLIASAMSKYAYPMTTTLHISPSFTFNYFIYRHVSIGIEYNYGLQYVKINGKSLYIKSVLDNNGIILQDSYQTVHYTFHKLNFLQNLVLNLNYNLFP